MNGPLHGHKVLVTRPKDQAEMLCRMVEADGGEAIELPTLEVSVSKGLNRQALLELITSASLIIFVSRNAVEFARQITGDIEDCLRGKKIIAIGDGTLRQLNAYSVYQASSPGLRSSSEALLDIPELDRNNINGRNVLIVRGGTGREFLHEGLVARGAIVQYANVYERSEPAITQHAIDAIWQQNCPDVIVVTSIQGLQNLIRMTTEQYRGIMFSKKLVVMSPRLAEKASEAGFEIPAFVATEQSDQGLLRAIKQTVE